MNRKRQQPSRLFLMRVAREQREAPVREPLERQLQYSAHRLREVQEALRGVERVVGSKVGELVVEDIGLRVSQMVERKIVEAIGQARLLEGSGPSAWVELRLSSAELAWLDARSAERRVLDAWKEKAPTSLSLSVDTTSTIARADHVTVLDVRLPEMGWRLPIANAGL